VELIEAKESAMEAKQIAEEASQSKSIFLANMSHEIRTPMNAVIGFTDMLLSTGLDTEQKDYTRTIKQSGESLLTLLNDILDFSKVEAGKIDMKEVDFDIEVLAYDACELIRPRLGNKDVEILCRIDDNLPALVNGDPHRIKQIFLNMMGNASKFTDKGEIELSLDAEEEQDGQVMIHTKVRDTGMGIPQDKIESIFEIFQQVDGSTSRKYGGTGLGLSICRKIANLMGGNVWAESEMGQGSTFHFTALLKQPDKKDVKRFAPVSLSGKNILITDDNIKNLEILTHALESAGMHVAGYSNGKEALKAIQDAFKANDPFDICILDIMMPGMDGYQLAKRIRSSVSESIPLIAFSSTIEMGGARESQEAGFNGFLPKPINRIKLFKMMELLLGETMDKGKLEEKEAKLVTQYSMREDAKHATTILLAEDNPVNQKLATKLLTKAGYKVDVAGNGKEAVEKFTAAPEAYDIILMDVQMPELNGLEATRLLREKGYTQVPIVAMTAEAMKGDKEKCLASGMNDYIPKPIKREIVFEILRKWVIEKE
jgi:CheY-like chemotaxis protein